MKEKMDKYEKYKLEWMIAHGYTLSDLILELELYRRQLEGEEPDLPKVFEEWEAEIGFPGAMIWACEDEWQDEMEV